ncbi:MAG: NADH-quinone oxidoreductase subunit J [Verrucomicrobiaceae bacterium]|nr:NADH-quinone oxidoreductase subunit J [Verrucomicrobiaceae bacterium]
MPAPLFYLLAFITLGFGLLVVLARNPVASALSLVMCFSGLAALFVTLDAYLIGTIQVLVYAGAVMVLFLFIIMLLDIKEEEKKGQRLTAVVGGMILAAVLTLQLTSMAGSFPLAKTKLDDKPLDISAASTAAKDKNHPLHSMQMIRKDLDAGKLPDTALMGQTLFDQYPLHLQMMGLLLLVGTVGVVVLSRRDTAKEESKGA